ncbi:glycoside hydrolase family 6 protein [Sorangium sp. So ce385]|uniref:glycoside hydrolase family 6 protein n=1 Tax=Sorangium sp. So ce385 TaxID=3133308 RepID=UPI003F5BBB7A
MVTNTRRGEGRSRPLLVIGAAILWACSDAATSSGTGAGTSTSSGAGAATSTSSGDGGGNSTSDAATAGSGAALGTGGDASSDEEVTVDISTPDGNPFGNAVLYVDPGYVARVQSSIERTTDPALVEKMEKAKQFSTGFWVDRIAAIDDLDAYLDGAFMQQKIQKKPVVSTIVLFNLPDKDCNNLPNDTEINTENGGHERYVDEYLKPLASVVAEHAHQRIVAIVEPRSLANIVRPKGREGCSYFADGYRDGVVAALQHLDMPHVYQYVDGGSGLHIGPKWSDILSMSSLIEATVASAGSPASVRGYATNVSGYGKLQYTDEDLVLSACSSSTSPCLISELDYVELLGRSVTGGPLDFNKFIIDTGRNGDIGPQDYRYAWYNFREAGLGIRPLELSLARFADRLDANLFMKQTGSSDGCYYDEDYCGTPPRKGPRPGQWFHEHFVDLVKNANPAL